MGLCCFDDLACLPFHFDRGTTGFDHCLLDLDLLGGFYIAQGCATGTFYLLLPTTDAFYLNCYWYY